MDLSLIIMFISSGAYTKCGSNTTSEFFAIEGNYLKYSCEVTFSGKWAPVMIWRNGTEKMLGVINESNGNTVKYSIIILITFDAKGSKIVCVTKFDQPKRDTLPKNAATNVS